MRLLIVRHGIAADPDPGQFAHDAERPLTDRGRRRMERNARGLARLLAPPDALYTSPLVRASQTAELLAAAWGGKPRPTVADLLAPGHTPSAVTRWLATESRKGLVVVVGHEPGGSALLAHLCAPRGGIRVDFRKGGAALLELGVAHGKLAGTLLWLATPRLLRAAR